MVEPDRKIERTFHQILIKGVESSSQQEIQVEHSEPSVIAEPRTTLSNYERLQFTREEFSVQAPTIAAKNFEIKASTIGMIQNSVQFDGFANEDPHAHLSDFLKICSTFKINYVSNDAIRLRLFPFCLRVAAYRWLTLLVHGSITTWKKMVEKFLARYLPLSKATRLRQELSSYKQGDLETLFEAHKIPC